MLKKSNFRYVSIASIKKMKSESASQAINKTIRMIEMELEIEFPRGSTPSESREIMVKVIGSYFR